MAKKGSIRGNADGENGENDSYTVNGRGVVPRKKMVREVKKSKHEGIEIYRRDGEDYLRSTKDSKKSNNIDDD
ncbi:MAG: DUF3892 domain-containing protein [Candidatus Gracilibacteria bacterium]